MRLETYQTCDAIGTAKFTLDGEKVGLLGRTFVAYGPVSPIGGQGTVRERVRLRLQDGREIEQEFFVVRDSIGSDICRADTDIAKL